jgi:hypothetical protein
VRTTLDIADDVLAAVRDLARREDRTVGDVLSDLARQALTGVNSQNRGREPNGADGFQSFPVGSNLVTNEVVDDLRDREGV